MKRLLVAIIIACVLMIGIPAHAAKIWDDMSWWGNTGATPEPVADSNTACCAAGRTGYWWWPKEPAGNTDDNKLWGNRGIIYQIWTKPVEEIPPTQTQQKTKRRTTWDNMINNILFDFDKALLRQEGKVEADKIIAEMKRYTKDTLVIEGHASDEGSAEYNMGLGQRRADAVKKYMVESGIDASRIETVSYGMKHPAVPNDTPANRKLNRRAEFKGTVVENSFDRSNRWSE